jgi:photosystem II stability/assembly factor-like uncharacterized protein
MDEDFNARLSMRARRAIPLIAAALTVIVVVSLIYLHPGFGASRRPRLLTAPAPSPPLISNRFAVTYDFATPTNGWSLVVEQIQASASFWVFATTDGASHWRRQLSGQCGLNDAYPNSVRFFDKNHGIVSLGCALYRTADGGKGWDRLPLPPYPELMVIFSGPLDGWFIGQLTGQVSVPHFLVTHDGGSTWSELPTPPVLVFGGRGGQASVQFRDSRSGWMGTDTGDRPAVYSTSDGGFTWQAHVLPSSPPQPSQGGKPLQTGTSIMLVPGGGVVAMASDESGYAVGYTSFDGGATWRGLAPAPGETRYSDFVFVDARNWWAMRYGTLFKTSDSGQTWKQVAQMMDEWDYLPGVVDSRHAWAQLRVVPGPGNPPQGTGLAMTADGGLHWTFVNVPQPF